MFLLQNIYKYKLDSAQLVVDFVGDSWLYLNSVPTLDLVFMFSLKERLVKRL